MKVLRNQARIIIRGRAGAGIIRYGAGPVVHDIIKINADAKAVRCLHHLNQLRLSPIFGGNGALLIGIAQIKRIKYIVTHGVGPAVAFGRVRHP